MTSDLHGKTALVTGAARGIGAGTARELVARGARVALLGLEPDALAALAAELGEDRAAWWEADVRDTQQLGAAVDAAAEHFGGLDLVLANAGISSYGTVRQIEAPDFERIVDVNLNGVYRTLHATIPHLVASGGYALVVSSQAAFTPIAGLAPYCATKAAVEALALACRQEVAHLGVGVGVCHPSWIDTDIVRGAEADLPAFRAVRRKLPWPSNTTTDLATCTRTIAEAMAHRRRRVYVPGSVRVSNVVRGLFSSGLAQPLALRIAGRTVPRLERDVEALGRAHSEHTPVT